MTPEETAYAIEVMQAYINGREIKFRPARHLVAPKSRHKDEDWHVISSPSWSWDSCEYRAEPMPREYYLNIYPGAALTHDTKESADACADKDRVECVKVREVRDEETA